MPLYEYMNVDGVVREELFDYPPPDRICVTDGKLDRSAIVLAGHKPTIESQWYERIASKIGYFRDATKPVVRDVRPFEGIPGLEDSDGINPLQYKSKKIQVDLGE
jgi:hypothetical protein